WRFYWLIPYPNERGLWVNFSSPLIWDAFAVGTYFVASVLFWFLGLIPDFAALRDHSSGWRAWIYARLAVGWRGTAQEWRHFRSAYTLLAGLITALVVSVHSIVSWDFAVAVVPGCHSPLFAPLVWLAVLCNSILPLVFFRRAARRNPAMLFGISILINVGMWTERFVIIVASLAHEYDTYSWGGYRPTVFEWTILLGSAGWF